MSASVLSLTDIEVGGHAVVGGVDLSGLPGVRRRLEDLGFAAGATVEVVRRAPLGDPTIYRVSDYEICLRSVHARAIRIEPSL